MSHPLSGFAPQEPDTGDIHAVVCYLRTANPGTTDIRLLDRQHARLQAACTAHHWTVVAWAEDLHQSGATLRRPGLQHALTLLATRHADALLARDHSRLAVNTDVGDQLAELARRGGGQLLTLNPLPTSTVARGDGRLPGRSGARR